MKVKFKHVAFVSLLVAGIALEVGGIFLPPLIPVGAVCLAGAIAMTKVKKKGKDNAQAMAQPQTETELDNQSNSSDELKVDVSVHHKKRKNRGLQFALNADKERHNSKDEHDAKGETEQEVIRHKP